MDIHVCKQCGSRFVYCRKCVFKPLRYKDAGFCSKECYEASKNVVVEPEIAETSVLVEEQKQIIEDVIQINEDIVAKAVSSDEGFGDEALTMVNTTIKKETNTYKKKKNKYKVHE